VCVAFSLFSIFQLPAAPGLQKDPKTKICASKSHIHTPLTFAITHTRSPLSRQNPLEFPSPGHCHASSTSSETLRPFTFCLCRRTHSTAPADTEDKDITYYIIFRISCFYICPPPAYPLSPVSLFVPPCILSLLVTHCRRFQGTRAQILLFDSGL
jgi:hypothetical protein